MHSIAVWSQVVLCYMHKMKYWSVLLIVLWCSTLMTKSPSWQGCLLCWYCLPCWVFLYAYRWARFFCQAPLIELLSLDELLSLIKLVSLVVIFSLMKTAMILINSNLTQILVKYRSNICYIVLIHNFRNFWFFVKYTPLKSCWGELC